MITEVEILLEKIKKSYAVAKFGTWRTEEVEDEMLQCYKEAMEKFNNELFYKEDGNIFIIFSQNKVWGYVLKVDMDETYKKGDILTEYFILIPYKGNVRGIYSYPPANIFGMYKVHWTGYYYPESSLHENESREDIELNWNISEVQ